MLVAAARFDLRIPGCRSLKEKRHVVKTLTASLRGDVQRRRRGGRPPGPVAARDPRRRRPSPASGYHLGKVMHEVERHVETFRAVEVIESDLSLHAPDD